jgi:phospholipase/carboxylesterase
MFALHAGFSAAQHTPSPAGPGQHVLRLDGVPGGVLQIPKRDALPSGTPLLVWLHGAGGTGAVSAPLAALADEFGFLVLAPDAREWTWDAILGAWGPDVTFIERAMAQTRARYTIDRERIWLGGFSDGGSYALALGISYGHVFRKVYAGAPGLMQPIEVNGRPPIFISHGVDDRTMPIDDTSRTFVPRLKALGYDVTYREHEGGHRLPPNVLREVIEWFYK